MASITGVHGPAIHVSLPQMEQASQQVRGTFKEYVFFDADQIYPAYEIKSDPGSAGFTEHLRLTEIMYHPAEPTGPETTVSTNRNDYEYIELKNVGSSSLDLRNVRFTKGVDFDFDGSAVETLGAGEYVLVVKNIAAFEARYGTGLPVAGEFEGNNLSNGGEQLKLSFGAGIAIHDINEYDDKAP